MTDMFFEENISQDEMARRRDEFMQQGMKYKNPEREKHIEEMLSGFHKQVREYLCEITADPNRSKAEVVVDTTMMVNGLVQLVAATMGSVVITMRPDEPQVSCYVAQLIVEKQLTRAFKTLAATATDTINETIKRMQKDKNSG